MYSQAAFDDGVVYRSQGGNLLKLARMVRLARLLQKIDRYSQYSAVRTGSAQCIYT